MNSTSLQKFLKIVCVLLTLGLAGTAGRTYYTYTQALEENRLKQERLAAVKKEINDLNESIAKYAAEKDEFAKLLFNERDVPAFLDGISKSAKETKVSILDMKTQKFQEVIVPQGMTRSERFGTKDKDPAKEPPPDYKKLLTLTSMPIQIEVEGEFTALVTFLGQLEVYEQLLTVTNVEIAVNRDYPNLRCKFTLRIYSLKSLEDLKST